MANISIHNEQETECAHLRTGTKKVVRKRVPNIWTVYTILTTPTIKDHVRRMSR
jgi:hypothetical protein